MDILLLRLGLALAIGLLIGLERGWRERDAPAQSRTAGIRTYGISGLLGGIFAALAQSLGAVSVLIAGFLGFAAIFAFYKAREATHDQDFSVTGVIAGLAVFALGALAIAGDYRAAAAAGTALAAILASRDVLHSLLKRLTWVELRSALILAVMTAIILPVLPDRPIDPWGGFNPREVWFFTVLIAAISYLGYIAVRLLGPTRGLIVSAVTGAMVSSTAVTLSLARTAQTTGNPYPMAGAASLAAMVSVARVCIVVALIEPSVLMAVAPPAVAAAFGFGLCAAALLIRRDDGAAVDAPSRSPFDLGSLLVFAVLFALVSMANAVLVRTLGTEGLVATSAVSGAIDVDVAVLSVLRLVGTSTTAATAGAAVLAAVFVNSLLKVVLAAASAPLRFSLSLLVATAVAAVLGGLAFFLLPVA
jgi:uncharacterized membrane protein (DUF4010 family)